MRGTDACPESTSEDPVQEDSWSSAWFRVLRSLHGEENLHVTQQCPFWVHSWSLNNLSMNCAGPLTHGFFFFSSKYNNASRSVAGWILSCKTCIGKEMPLRGGWVWISGRFSTGGRWMPLKPVFFKGQLYFKGNQREISKMWLYPHHSGLKKRNTPIWNNEDEPGSHSAKWNKPEAGRQTLCDLTYIWSQKRLTEAENRIGAARGKGQRCQWWVQSFSYAWWVSSGKRTLACRPEGGLNYNFEIC